MKVKTTSLVEDFQEYFNLELATTPLQLESVYRIRYRVYCEEFKYEPSGAFPDKQETDEFDANASHCLVSHVSTGMPAGCARLVHVDEQSLMPMERFCASAMDKDIIRSFDGRRDSICEFSRLGVDGAFRRRAGEHVTRFGEISSIDCTKREQRTFSLIAISTILAAFAMSDLIGRPHCFAMMEPFLPRLLRRSGIVVHPAGQEIEYHGVRAPYYFETHATVGGMTDEMREFYEAIRASFANSAFQGQGSALATSEASRGRRDPLLWWSPFDEPAFAA
ncbi:MAG: PEP-CTERM/exosortase system-associated acyltransferase [Halioglobus sp.]